MTSALPPSHHFAKDLRSDTTFYDPYTNNEPLTAGMAMSTASLDPRAWQTPLNDYRTTRAPPIRQAQKYRDLALILPSTKSVMQAYNPLSEGRSPIAFSSSTSTESVSTRSKSNDSANLTPNSIASVCDQFPLQNSLALDSRLARNVKNSLHVNQYPANMWNEVKEFRPNLSPTVGRTVGGEASRSTIPHDVSYSDKVWRRTTADNQYAPTTTWGGFNPVLPITPVNNTPCHGGQPISVKPQIGGWGQAWLNKDGAGMYEKRKPTQYIGASDTMTNGECLPTVSNFQGSSRQATNGRRVVNGPNPNEWHHNDNGQYKNDGVDIERAFTKSIRQTVTHPVSYQKEYSREEEFSQGPMLQCANRFLPQYFESTAHSQQAYDEFCLPNVYSRDVKNCHYSSYYPTGNSLTDLRSGQYYDPMNDPLFFQSPGGQQRISRSRLLEEFRVNKNKKYELKDIYEHIVEFSGDQVGSRFMQLKLETANSDEKDRILGEIACDSRQLMTDIFGNYVIQKLFDHGSQAQKRLLASHMKGHMLALSTQMYGCRVVQKAFETILTDQQASLIKELDREGLVLEVIDDLNGNHVIQKAIQLIPGKHIQFIVDAHRGRVHKLAKHQYGCRVIQRILEHCQPHAKRQILDELHVNISDLIQDPFGNYVVQHVIVNGEARDRKLVIDVVQSRLLENSMHKNASNVVEKALDHADEHQRRAMLQKLTARDEVGHSLTTKLLTHQYGNYVMQTSAAHLNGQALVTAIAEMNAYLAQLRRVSSGRQVSALEKAIREAQHRLDKQKCYNMNSVYSASSQSRIEYGAR